MALVRTSRHSQFLIESPTVDISVDFSAFTPSANSIVVVVMGCINDGGRVDTGGLDVTGGGLTWTRQLQTGVEDSGWSQTCEVWTAPVGASPPSVALNVAGSIASGDYGAHVHINVVDFTGHDTSSPIGTKKILSGAGTEYGAYSMALDAAPASSSIVIASRYCSTSGASNTDATVGSGWTELYDYGSYTLGQGDLQTQERTGSTSTSVAWVDAVETAEGSYPGLWIQFAAIEIKEASSGVTCLPGIAQASRSIGAFASTSSSSSSPGSALVLRRAPSPTVYTEVFASSAQHPAIQRRVLGSMQLAQTSLAASAPTLRERHLGSVVAAISGVPNSIAHPVVRMRLTPQGVGKPPVDLGSHLVAYSHWPEPTGILTSSAITTVAGSMLIARVSNWYASQYDTMRGMTDSKGNVWITLEQAWITSDEWDDSTSILYQCATNERGSSHTFTCSYLQNSECTFSVVELFNVTGMYDIQHTAYGYQYGNVFASESITVPRMALLLCWLELNWWVTAPTTATAGWTMVHEYQADDSSMHEALFYRVVEAGTYSCTLTVTGIAQGGGVTIAAFIGDNPSIIATPSAPNRTRLSPAESVAMSIVEVPVVLDRKLGPSSASVVIVVDTAPNSAQRFREVGTLGAGAVSTQLSARRVRRLTSIAADMVLTNVSAGRRKLVETTGETIGSSVSPLAAIRRSLSGLTSLGTSLESSHLRRAVGGHQTIVIGAWWPAAVQSRVPSSLATVGILVVEVAVPVIRVRALGSFGVSALASHSSVPSLRSQSAESWSTQSGSISQPVTVPKKVTSPAISSIIAITSPQVSALRTREVGFQNTAFGVSEASASLFKIVDRPLTSINVLLAPSDVERVLGSMEISILAGAHVVVTSAVQTRSIDSFDLEMSSLASVSSAVRFDHASSPIVTTLTREPIMLGVVTTGLSTVSASLNVTGFNLGPIEVRNRARVYGLLTVIKIVSNTSEKDDPRIIVRKP